MLKMRFNMKCINDGGHMKNFLYQILLLSLFSRAYSLQDVNHSYQTNFNLANVETCKISRPHENCYWVIPGRFLASEYPGNFTTYATEKKLDLYLDAGINYFIDLTESHELNPYENILYDKAKDRGVTAEYIRISIQDMNIPSTEIMDIILCVIHTALLQGKNVCVHCWGGIGRTGTVIGSFLTTQGMTGIQALKQLSEWWQHVAKSKINPYSPQTQAQRDFVAYFQHI